MEKTYGNFAGALLEICDDKVNADKLRSMFKAFDNEETEPKLDFDSIESFKSRWKQVFGSRRRASVKDIKTNWSEFAVPSEKPKRNFYATPSGYFVHQTYDGHEQTTQNLFVNPNEEKVKNSIEWINGERRMIYQRTFGVPCQCYEDMAPWERERWIAFCLQIGYEAVVRIWRNFCESENSYFHMQPGLSIDKIWQAIGALNRGPVHEGASFEDADLKEPELLA